MRNIEKSTRFYERTKLEIPVEVQYVENENDVWTENTLTNEIANCGVGFVLSRQVEPKRLIKLRLPMPKHLRFYDFGEKNYEVYGIVSSIQILTTESPDRFEFRIGVALIGKNPPASFERDPLTLYDLSPVLPKEGFWHFREIPRQRGRYSRTLEDRENYQLDMIIQTLGQDGKVIETAIAGTKDISESGAALVTKLKFDCPKYVIVKSPERDICLLAIVHRIKPLEETDMVKLNLEFISGKWHFL